MTKSAQQETTGAAPRAATWLGILPDTRYHLAIPGGARRGLALGWLALGLLSLIGSGVFSVLLVLSRVPYFKDWVPLVDFFRVALVVHVDLSVLVWFLALGGVMWSVNSDGRMLNTGWSALAFAAVGTLLMCAAPFIGRGNPVMSNYVPVLDDPMFLAGLTTFGAGFLLLVVRSLATAPLIGARLDGDGALRFGLNVAAVAAGVTLIALAWSYFEMPPDLPARGYYDILFWGPGHVVQFTYTLLMLVAWLWLATACGARVPLTPRLTVLLLAIGLISVFLIPILYLAYGVTSVEHRHLLTWLMQFGGGLAIVPVGAAVVWGMWRGDPLPDAARPLRAALLASVVLFAVGGTIGFMIHGSNVKIPAHYHGCIVGVTLALMGVVYLLLPRFGFSAPSPRLATWQAYLYGAGQMMHIAGLVWSGGYGVQRKVAGSEQVLRTGGEIAGMGLMGLGGLIAVVGGLMFVVVVVRALLLPRAKASAGDDVR
jgi:cytochrome c oxidase subunit 1